jgi:hypothetical protein
MGSRSDLSLDQIRVEHGICQAQQFRVRFQERPMEKSHRQSAGIQHRVGLRHDERSVPDVKMYDLPEVTFHPIGSERVNRLSR